MVVANAELRDEGKIYDKENLCVEDIEAKLLRLPWSKQKDTMVVIFTKGSVETSKREVLTSKALVFDSLGVASPQPE